MRTPTSLKEPELEFVALPARPGRITSIRCNVVLSKACPTFANTPLAPEILMGSAVGTPPAGAHVNTAVALVEGLVLPSVQLPVALAAIDPFALVVAGDVCAGAAVIGPGYAILSLVVVRGDVAMSEPTTSTPEPLVPGMAVSALLFVLMSPLSTSGMIVIWTWAKRLGAIAKSTRMVTSPANRDFNVISSPFEVVQELKLETTNQRAVVLPAG